MDSRVRPGDSGIHARDVLVALAVLVVQLVGGHLANEHMAQAIAGVRVLDRTGWLLLLAGPILLMFRRRWPWAVLAATMAVVAGYLFTGYGYGPIFVSLIIAFLTAATSGSRWFSYPLVPAGFLLLVWPGPPVHTLTLSTWQVVSLLVWLGVLVVVAEGIRQRRAIAVARGQRAEAARRREQADRARQLAEQQRLVTEERLTIARELHDVLAHSLSLINVQSAVALELLDRKPEQAATALAAIKSASRDALGEVNDLLRSLRAGTGTSATTDPVRAASAGGGADFSDVGRDPAPVTPAVRITELDDLLGPARAAGLTVRTVVPGTMPRLPAVVDLAAARIVQESLTNVLRHAPGAEALVTVRCSVSGIDLTVDDTGPRTPPAIPPQRPIGHGGNGIAGMRERAHILGGEFTAGPRPGGGFRVHARLPVPGHPAQEEQ